MAIEGPLRELGIHDVFQLLDLSRKTGVLSVVSELRDNEGRVYFDNGKVIFASIRSNPHPLGTMLLQSGKVTEADLERARASQEQGDRRRFGEILVASGALTQREMERQVRLQIEAVVFELMSWREGFFSFVERTVSDVPAEATIRISTESLLMEGARRIDEWSRIADKVPHLGVIPTLATTGGEHETLLDLLPNEWEVLTMIDGERDLRAIASTLARSEFDVAKIVYGLVTTGVVELRAPARVSVSAALPVEDASPLAEEAAQLLAKGRVEEALGTARRALTADARCTRARLTAARALTRLGRASDAWDELRRAVQADPHHPEVQLELAYASAGRGELTQAVEIWSQYLKKLPSGSEAERARRAMESAARLRDVVEAHYGG